MQKEWSEAIPTQPYPATLEVSLEKFKGNVALYLAGYDITFNTQHHRINNPLFMYMYICMFDLACFFLSSFSSLIKNMYIHVGASQRGQGRVQRPASRLVDQIYDELSITGTGGGGRGRGGGGGGRSLRFQAARLSALQRRDGVHSSSSSSSSSNRGGSMKECEHESEAELRDFEEYIWGEEEEDQKCDRAKFQEDSETLAGGGWSGRVTPSQSRVPCGDQTVSHPMRPPVQAVPSVPPARAQSVPLATAQSVPPATAQSVPPTIAQSVPSAVSSGGSQSRYVHVYTCIYLLSAVTYIHLIAITMTGNEAMLYTSIDTVLTLTLFVHVYI